MENNKRISYAGIGSRQTPIIVLHTFFDLGKILASEPYNFILRSGGAPGADITFEHSCDKGHGAKEIYLPWPGFNGSGSKLSDISLSAIRVAEKFHPNWPSLSEAAKKLMSCNSYQVLGKTLIDPSSFILCWTPNGSGSGGTGQAIRIAKAKRIRVFDAGNYIDMAKYKEDVLAYCDELIRKISEADEM